MTKTKKKNTRTLLALKRETARAFKVSLPSNIKLLQTYHNLIVRKKLKPDRTVETLLQTRPGRSLSGIVNVSALTKPYPCPGQCIFCPTLEGFPKSYLAGEPAADRARQLNYNPFKQVQSRLESLRLQGHSIDKIELRIIGGTWSFYPKQYQTWFIKKCFEAANQKKAKTLIQAQKTNQKAKNRIVGLSIETRPDFITEKEIFRLRELGVTLVEMGVQTTSDEIHQQCQTGLTAGKISQTTRLLKEAGFKVLYQIMPNLPGSTPAKDLEVMDILFSDQGFKPDWLKIYPCLVCKGAKLYQQWQKGRWQPYSDKQLIALLIKIKTRLPYWVRLTRLFRDIPAQTIMAGCKTSNLRETVQQKMKKRKLECRCIRCREIRQNYNPKEKVYLFREEYSASDGREIFLSFENKPRTKLYSFLRLRVPGPKNAGKPCFSVLKNAGLIREIQTFGAQVPLRQTKKAPQHRGLGKKLIQKTEEITLKEFGLKKIAVIAGIGVREYYQKLGYRLQDTYMVKNL